MRTVRDLFFGSRGILAFMRTCISCDEPIEGRRKDAKFCAKSACRSRDYRKRQDASAAAHAAEHAHAAAAVLACPCGRRYRLSVCGLDGTEAPGLEPVPGTAETVTRTVLTADAPQAEAADRFAPLPPSVANRSEQIAAAATAPVSLPAPVPPSHVAESAALPVSGQDPAGASSQELFVASPTAPASQSVPMPPPQAAGPAALPASGQDRAGRRDGFRTVELYFLDTAGRRMPFWDAIRRRFGERWRLRGYAKPALGVTRSDGTGLGGEPGRWHDYYRDRGPSAFGLDPDVAVLYWDDDEQRACAADAALLEEALGIGWRGKLRELCNGSAGAR